MFEIICLCTHFMYPTAPYFFVLFCAWSQLHSYKQVKLYETRQKLLTFLLFIFLKGLSLALFYILSLLSEGTAKLFCFFSDTCYSQDPKTTSFSFLVQCQLKLWYLLFISLICLYSLIKGLSV